MADYVFNFFMTSNPSGKIQSSGPPAPGVPTATLTDDDGGSSTFDPGEDLSVDSGSGSPVAAGDFYGTTVINGIEFVVTVELNNGNNPVGYGLFGYVPDPNTFEPPARFDPGRVDTDPFTVCFAAGTLIATPDGERVVESLAIGDRVLTADGDVVTVRWLGRQTLRKLFTQPERMRAVRIAAGALGHGVPHTDLIVTADHGLVIGDYVVNASALVGAPGVDFVPLEEIGDVVVYYHIETEGHRVVLANGAPAETFVDYVTRRLFDNYAEFEALYGTEETVEEMELRRVSAVRQMPAELRERFGLVLPEITFTSEAA